MVGFLKKGNKKEKQSDPGKNNERASQSASVALDSKSQKLSEKEIAKRHKERLKQLDKSPEQQNAELRQKLKQDAAPKTTVQQIKYSKMFEDGICEVEPGLYSRTVKFSDINYQTARQDEQRDLFTRYCEVLNYCDPSLHLQLNIINRRIDKEDFRDNMLLRYKEDGLDQFRKEMNTMLQAKAIEGQNSIIREKYLTFSTFAANYENSIPVLARLESDFASALKTLGCEIHSLTGFERLELIHELFKPEESFTLSYRDLIGSSWTTKSFVAPTSFDFSPKNYFTFGEHYGQVLYFHEYPSEASDRIITEISDLPVDMNISIHMTAEEPGKALEYVRRQIAFMEMETTGRQDAAVQKGRNTEIAVPMETRARYEDAKNLLELLENGNQRLFKVTILVYTYAQDFETLQDNVYQIMACARKHTLKIAKLDLMQREGINSILPVGKNHVVIQRTLPTAAAAVFIPFTTVELYQKNGIYYGQNAASRNLIFFSRYNLKAPNGFILGTPGSGKSFAAKGEAWTVLLNDPNAEVLIIDPEREYTGIAAEMPDIAEVIHISAGSKNYINPMDITMNYADEEEPLQLKAEFVLTLCELLVGGKYGLKGAARSIISRACKICYAPYFSSNGKKPAPTLLDFYNEIKKQPEPEAQSLALELELYIEGTLSVFAHRTNVDTTKRFVVYDVRDLGKELRTLGMLVVLDQIWNRITANRSKRKRTWVYIDEIQLLLSNEFSSNYFFELWSRARKWGAVPTGITQNVETLLLSDNARRMLSNSDFIMMLNQAPPDRAQLAGLLNMSNKQLNHITNTEAGHGLLFAGKAIIPFVNKFPVDTALYRIMTTKIEEVADADTSENLVTI